MTNKEIMRYALREHTFPHLKSLGFEGKYPHFHRFNDDCIELISFQTNKYGGSFTVEVSAVFQKKENTNIVGNAPVSMESLPNVFATNERYRLKGMFDGWFYYSDVYRKRTLFFENEYFSPNEIIPTKRYKLVQIFDENTAVMICREVNKQLEKAFAWLEKFERNHK